MTPSTMRARAATYVAVSFAVSACAIATDTPDRDAVAPGDDQASVEALRFRDDALDLATLACTGSRPSCPCAIAFCDRFSGRWRCGGTRPEVCNSRDDDCDGQVDERLLNACGRCGPTPAEACNERDDDCDGEIDEGVLNRCGRCGPTPSETCNERDDDCDGEIDESLRCPPPCEDGDPCELHPPQCQDDFVVRGVIRCSRSGVPRCEAPFCEVCGTDCGGCMDGSCRLDTDCSPGLLCGAGQRIGCDSRVEPCGQCLPIETWPNLQCNRRRPYCWHKREPGSTTVPWSNTDPCVPNECRPSCPGNCGHDGCLGSCGTCDDGQACSSLPGEPHGGVCLPAECESDEDCCDRPLPECTRLGRRRCESGFCTSTF